jgi:antitoxin FitA
MAQIIVRGLEQEVVERLKKRAQKDGRSLEAEVRLILEQAATLDSDAALKLVNRIRKQFGDRKFDDSTALVREDRDR